MEPLPDWNALQRLTGHVSRADVGFSTNLFAGRDQVERWGAAGRLRGLATDGAALVLRGDRDFDHVYHVARNDAALISALSSLPAGRYASDLVGRGEALDRTCDAYTASGFVLHAFLCRMARVAGPAALQAGDDVQVAGTEDTDDVAAFLDRLLDRFTEQLPEPDDLQEAARNGRLLLVREGTFLSGMLMYDVQGRLAHLRFWHVDPNVQAAGVGRRLMASFLSRCADAQRIVLWVIGDNHRSISIYRHYGFKTDGLLDRIMISHKDQH